MFGFYAGAIIISQRKSKLFTQVFSRIGNRIGINKLLLVINSKNVQFFEGGIGNAPSKAMP
jgi:hypothetical protein